MRCKVIFAVLSLIISTKANAQSYYFRHYQVENGLLNNMVICSMQDNKGFMWFGTNEGLHRFNGYTFKTYTNKSNDAHSIHGKLITCLYQDANGTIWVGSNTGLSWYDPVKESFHQLKGFGTGSIYGIIMDRQKNLWFILNFDLIKYDTKTKSFYYPKQLKGIATSVCITADGSLWASTVNGVIKKYNADANTFASYNMFGQSKPANSKWIKKIYDAGAGQLLIGTINHGVKLFNIKTGTCTDIVTHNADGSAIYVRDFLRYTLNEYWIATESGIYIYNIATGRSVNLRKDRNDPYSLSDNSVYTLCKDAEGGIWAGTHFGGINYYQKQLGVFKKYFQKSGSNSLSGDIVRTIYPGSNGNLWIGTEDDGLNRLDTKTGNITHFSTGGTPNNISYNNIHAILTNNNELWVSTYNRAIDVLNINTGKVVRHYATTSSSKIDFVSCLLRTRSGKIMAGTLEGLYEFDFKFNKFKLIKELPLKRFYLNLFEAKNGMLWAGTYAGGLQYFDPVTKKSGNYRLDPGSAYNSHTNKVNWIFENSDGNLWLATEGGLCRFDPATKKIKRYTIKDGLPSNTIFAILQDNNRNLWISTSKGLVCFTPATSKLNVYNRINGLLSDQFNYNSAYKDTDGHMYFGSIKGLISFHPDDITDDSYIPPVYITGFQVNNKELDINETNSVLKQSVLYADAITLPYNRSSFSIDFAALSYIVPELTEYAYKLQGLNQGWIHLKTNRKVYFTGLAPGTYTFLVKALNNGKWNKNATALTIKISPPFWASVWAYIAYILIIIGCIYYIIRRYHNRTLEKHRHEKEKEIYNAKIEFFTNVAHEIRTPLTLIKGPLDVIMKQSEAMPAICENLQIMEKNTDLLLNLTNQLLDFRKIESKDFSMYFVKTDVSGIIENNYLRYKNIACQKNLALKKLVPRQPCYAYADIDALNKIISNLLDNAIKYAGSKVYIELLPAKNKSFTILVKNDGYLIPAELREKIFEPFYRLDDTSKQTGSGIGLSFARSLAELHKGRLELNEQKQKMNVFALTLPVYQLTEHETVAGIKTGHTAVHNSSGKPIILIVDDNKEILKFISVNLDNMYDVLAASNGADAINILQKEAVHLVISDVVMPEMDGFELCSHIKSTIEYSHVPVILLTAKNTLQSKIDGLTFGADAYIEKPFSLEHVEAQIASLLNNRNKIREYFAASPLAHIRSLANSKQEEEFLEKLNGIINDNLANTHLDVDHLADLMNMGRRTFYRKIKAISNLSPTELINIARLKKTAALLLETDHKLYTICKMVGYSSKEKLRRNFIKQFGVTPSEYVKKAEQK